MSGPAPARRTPEGGYIGAPIPRREDARLLTGRGTFVDDLELANAAHAAMVRSPHAHARVLRVDGSAALALPGVLAVLTAALRDEPRLDEAGIRDTLAGHLCRCTGYQGMVDAVLALVASGAPPGAPAKVDAR